MAGPSKSYFLRGDQGFKSQSSHHLALPTPLSPPRTRRNNKTWINKTHIRRQYDTTLLRVLVATSTGIQHEEQLYNEIGLTCKSKERDSRKWK
ncbi:hypothetical protein RSOLAG1IB_08579 [Rhizoctonia solani AG-1 IB]|uniref:Uncharacterized protein n=1 Tax=Thanatephorus cucumeris (strain AG1-IB / isolate 7/3/14) TaxID=1108050 RepID=A0A0B7FQK5_THACB|nr:hypothetical protein RSOLAG1IB_08579 [Rhizoctonia solani AG-1 IB]